jgi:hypothetical protein
MSVQSLQRGRPPPAADRLRLRLAQPQKEIERTLGRRKPVCLSAVRTRRVVSDVYIDGAIVIKGERVAIADCETVDRVGDQEALVVMQLQRPECENGRDLVLFKVRDVAALAGEPLPFGVDVRNRVDRVVLEVRPEPDELCARRR